jgi:hypothetical protein
MLLGLTTSCSPATPPSRPLDAPAGPSGAANPTGPALEATPGAASSASVPVAPAQPLPVPLTSAEARVGQTSTALAPGATNGIEPDSTFEIRASAGLRDARLVLLDSQDLLVPATVESEISSAASRFTLVPQEPLRAGSSYLLRLEGVGGRLIRSASDGSYEPLILPLRVSGTPPPRPPPKKAKKNRGG